MDWVRQDKISRCERGKRQKVYVDRKSKQEIHVTPTIERHRQRQESEMECQPNLSAAVCLAAKRTLAVQNMILAIILWVHGVNSLRVVAMIGGKNKWLFVGAQG